MPEDPLHDLRARLAEGTAGATREELLKSLLFHARTLLELRNGLLEAKHARGGKSAVWDRVSVHQALHAMNRFLRAHDMQDLSSPIVMLQGALEDLEHGLKPAMLRPRPDGDRKPPHSKQLRGYAAGIMDRLMTHAHMRKPEAAKWVSGELSAAGWGVEPNTVISWRQKRNHKGHPELCEAYRTIIDMPEWANEPLAHAERLVASLISVHLQKDG